MPKDPNKDKKKKGRNERKDMGKKGSAAEQATQKAKKSRRSTAKIYLPAIIKKQFEDDPAMSADEISYRDLLICVEIEKYAKQGLTNDQIIDRIGISRDTFYRKLKTEPYFSYVLYKHRGIAVGKVENALMLTAEGFEYFEQQATPSGKVVAVLKRAMPNVNAQRFFLTNRAPDEWKNKVESTVQLGQDISAIGVVIKRRE